MHSTALTIRATRRQTKDSQADLFQTPEWVLDYLLPYVPDYTTIWEPCAGKGNLVTGINRRGRERGILSFGTDILYNPQADMLTYTPSIAWDMLVTNPPFGPKDEVIARAYELGKPWALLLPATALFEGRPRLALYRRHGVQCIILPRRPEFETPNGANGGSWFPVAWFTWGLALPRDLLFPE